MLGSILDLPFFETAKYFHGAFGRGGDQLFAGARRGRARSRMSAARHFRAA